MTVEQFREFMIELAVASGKYIRPHFRDRDLVVEHKEDRSTVTEVDRGGERLIREMIADRYPDHGVIGEEYGEDHPDAELVWVIDPIDGTDSFITGVPLWGTLIALMHNGEPLLGCIHQPVLGQLLIGDGETATLNGAMVMVRDTDRLESATLLYSNPVTADVYQNGPAFNALVRRCHMARTWGDCYGYLLVAGGWADIMCDPIMNPWDIAALVPIVRGAGGVITDWTGADPVRASSTVATTPGLHSKVLAALNP